MTHRFAKHSRPSVTGLPVAALHADNAPTHRGSRWLVQLLCLLAAALLPFPVAAQDTEAPSPIEDGASSTPAPRTHGADVEAIIAGLDLPTLSPGEPLTLHDALQYASTRNFDILAAEVEIDKAEARLKQAWGGVLPMAQAAIQYVRADHPDEIDMSASMGPLFEALGLPADAGGGTTVIRRADDVSGSLTVSVPLVNLQSWYTIRVAERAVDLTKLSIDDARQKFFLGVAQAYYFSLMSLALVDLQGAQIESAAHQLSVASKKHELGTGLRIDVVRAETDLAQAVQALHDAHLALDTARDVLGTLTDVGGLPMPTQAPGLELPSESQDELVDLAQELRLDLQVTEAQIALAEEQIDASWMQFLPSLAAVWQATYQFTEPSDMGSSDRLRWNAIFTLTIPIYNHFRYGDLDHARASLKQAELQAEGARSTASQQVRQAYRFYRSALAAVDNAAQQQRLAAEALSLVENAYAAGAGSSLEVTEARKAISLSQVNWLTKRLEAQIALLSLINSLGQDLLDL